MELAIWKLIASRCLLALVTQLDQFGSFETHLKHFKINIKFLIIRFGRPYFTPYEPLWRLRGAVHVLEGQVQKQGLRRVVAIDDAQRLFRVLIGPVRRPILAVRGLVAAPKVGKVATCALPALREVVLGARQVSALR